jgi:hypothetical protein
MLEDMGHLLVSGHRSDSPLNRFFRCHVAFPSMIILLFSELTLSEYTVSKLTGKRSTWLSISTTFPRPGYWGLSVQHYLGQATGDCLYNILGQATGDWLYNIS